MCSACPPIEYCRCSCLRFQRPDNAGIPSRCRGRNKVRTDRRGLLAQLRGLKRQSEPHIVRTIIIIIITTIITILLLLLLLLVTIVLLPLPGNDTLVRLAPAAERAQKVSGRGDSGCAARARREERAARRGGGGRGQGVGQPSRRARRPRRGPRGPPFARAIAEQGCQGWQRCCARALDGLCGSRNPLSREVGSESANAGQDLESCVEQCRNFISSRGNQPHANMNLKFLRSLRLGRAAPPNSV